MVQPAQWLIRPWPSAYANLFTLKRVLRTQNKSAHEHDFELPFTCSYTAYVSKGFFNQCSSLRRPPPNPPTGGGARGKMVLKGSYWQ